MTYCHEQLNSNYHPTRQPLATNLAHYGLKTIKRNNIEVNTWFLVPRWSLDVGFGRISQRLNLATWRFVSVKPVQTLRESPFKSIIQLRESSNDSVRQTMSEPTIKSEFCN